MEWLFLLVLGFILYKVFGAKSSNDGSSPRRGSSTPYTPPAPPARQQPKDTYRPTPDRGSTGIVFADSGTPSGTGSSAINQKDLEDLCDAFTGEKLDVSKGLFRCQKCKVHYHAASFEVLREQNNGACVACGSSSIASLSQSRTRTSGRNHDPSCVTLENVRSHIGRVVTFEGFVHRVETSRRGSDYAVMFEDKTWTKGFKLVFFREATRTVGGAAFINALRGKNVRVRGLVVDHKTFGLEIIVSQPSMILSIR